MSVTATFVPYDLTNSEGDLHKHSGERVEVTGVVPLDHDEFSLYIIKFPDGTTAEAFADELQEWSR